LLQKGALSARPLSKLSEVPYGRIYDVINSLESKGIVVKNNKRPQVFYAVEPKIAIDRLKEAKKAEIQEIFDQVDNYVDKLNQDYQNKNEDDIFWKVGIGDNLLPVYITSIKETRNTYKGYIELTAEHFDKFQYLIPEYVTVFEKMKSLKVDVKILLGVNDMSVVDNLLALMPQIMDLFPKDSIRVTKIMTYPFSIVDNKKVVLKVKNPASTDEDLAVLYIWQEKLAYELINKFNLIWETAKELSFTVKANEIN
jgi:HTH-type transcriptional regulator, sugar sensing transcriptional regulator